MGVSTYEDDVEKGFKEARAEQRDAIRGVIPSLTTPDLVRKIFPDLILLIRNI